MRFFAASRARVQALLTDNGSPNIPRPFAAACHRLGPRHFRTRRYRPRTNGKAERFIQTPQRQWAYAFPFPSSQLRTALLPRYIHFYNHHGAHASLAGKPPISRPNQRCGKQYPAPHQAASQRLGPGVLRHTRVALLLRSLSIQ